MNQPLHVLLVDDDNAFCKFMGQQLANEGLQVELATSGREAVLKTRACNGEFDVAVIDQVMGPPNGSEIMMRLRQYYPSIETIILTGWGDMGPGEKAMELGAFSYVSKPVKAKELALNIRLAARFGQERQRSHTLETLVSAGVDVGTSKSEEQLYRRLYKAAAQLLPSLDGFLISEYDEESREVSFPFCFARGKRFSMPSRTTGNSITEHVLRTKRPLLLAYGDREFREEHKLNVPDPHLGYFASEIAAPMFLDGRISGSIIAATYEKSVHYTPEQLQVLQAFANQAATAIRNFQQLEEARQLRDATAALGSAHGTEAVLKAIVKEAHELVGSDFTGVILQEENGRLKKVLPVVPANYFDLFGDPRQQGGVTRAVVQNRKPRIIYDTTKDPLVKKSVLKAGIRSMLALPLIHRERVLGVLYTHLLSHRQFGAHDVNLWAAFATQAAAALDRAIEEEKQISDYMRLTDELGSLMGAAPLKATIARIATAAKTIFQSDTCRLAYVDPPTGQIVKWEWAEGDPRRYRFESKPRPNGLTMHVLRSQEPLFRSAEDEEKPRPVHGLLSRGLHSVATVPLVYGGRTTGILHCNYLRKRQPFGEHQKTMMQAFGAHAAMALDRARRDDMSRIWKDLEKEILVSTNLHSLYKLFAEKAHKVLRADFSVFYPFDPTATDKQPKALLDECICIGELRKKWRRPAGGMNKGVYEEIAYSEDGLLIVNDLHEKDGDYASKLARREGIKAFVAVRLEVILAGSDTPQLAGMLFLNYRRPCRFEPTDLIELRYASDLVAAGILRLNLQADLQKAFEKRNKQLRAVVDIFRAFEYGGASLNLDLIAHRAGESLGIDICTILEYDSKRGKFAGRGAYGLRYPKIQNTPRPKFRDLYMNLPDPTVIPDVREDGIMRDSKFVRREGVESTAVYPLRVEGEGIGLFFANFRIHREPSQEEMESIGLFADLAALALHGAKLRNELSETQLKLERRYFLVWVSMIEDSWRHSLVQKASSIRNHTVNLQKRLGQHTSLPRWMNAIPGLISDIDRLASEIAAAPPRLPHYWEMQAEMVPLAPLLEEVAKREYPLSFSTTMPEIRIQVEVDGLGGVQVRGYRRWLIYLLEALLQNARNAVSRGGKIIIKGEKQEGWAEICIQDNGKGVPKPIRAKLFRELLPRKRDRRGLGIGSLLAATIVEEHGGNIELKEPGPGNTTVLIRLPIVGKTDGG